MGLMDEKVVVVTGGGNGIGRAYCQGIAKEGGAVVVVDSNSAAAGRRCQSDRGQRGKPLSVQVDVARKDRTRM